MADEGKAANWLKLQPLHVLFLYGSAASFLIGVVAMLITTTRLDMVGLGLLLWVCSQIAGERKP